MASTSTGTSTPASLEVQMISLEEEPKSLERVRAIFPQAKRHAAVDLRGCTPQNLRGAGFITHSTLHTLESGRKWHKELSTMGAVGLQHANRLLLSSGTQPILVLEEDCVLHRDIARHVDLLLENLDKFDVAVFGARLLDDRGTQPPKPPEAVPFLPDGWVRNGRHTTFILMHCCLYSPRGRQRVAEFYELPQEVQIDAYLSMLANAGELEVLLYLPDTLAWQSMHFSTIQESMTSFSTCKLCSMAPHAWVVTLRTAAILVVCAILATYVLLTRRGAKVR